MNRFGVALAVFDLDGTLVLERNSWRTVHNWFGTLEAAGRNREAFEAGEIGYDDYLRRDIGLWPRPLHISSIEGILSNYHLREGVRGVLMTFRRAGIGTAIVSAGLQILAHAVAKDLSIDYVLANEISADELGYLTGDGMGVVDPHRKDQALARLLGRIGLSPELCLAVGDTKYDLPMLRMVRQGFLIGAEPDPQDRNLIRLNSFDEILVHTGIG